MPTEIDTPGPKLRTGGSWRRAPGAIGATAVLPAGLSLASVGGASVAPAATPFVGAVTTTTVPVGGEPITLAVDASTDTVYIANLESNSVSVINGATNTVTATVPVGSEPDWLDVDATTDVVYVANYASKQRVGHQRGDRQGHRDRHGGQQPDRHRR